MRPRDHDLAQQLEKGLLSFDSNKQALIGIHDFPTRVVFIEQLLESIHRVNYGSVLLSRKLSERNIDPNDEMFDPLKAAILHKRKGNIDEAFWLIFLFIHFGKHAKAGWRYARDVYGRLGEGALWDWDNICNNPTEFKLWLNDNQSRLKRDGVLGGFGNHRKYESLDAYSPSGTGTVVESYVRWVGPSRNHQDMIDRAYLLNAGDTKKTFEYLYKSMDVIRRFGRTARFDYLTMVGKLGLAPIEPGLAFLQFSTGPIKGARLLFGGNPKAPLSWRELEVCLVALDIELKVGMQVLEDALCNWQKNPREFKKFRL